MTSNKRISPAGASKPLLVVILALLAFAPLAPALAQTPNDPASDSAEPMSPPNQTKPIALVWKIVIGGIVLAAVGGASYVSLRAWRSSNLFDRQYRLPPAPPAALRLGAPKSGGWMATIRFGPDSPSSGSEDL
jgi:hypothetical protein